MSDSNKGVLATAVSALMPLVMGVLGLYFTNVYKEQESEANRINQDRLELERQQRLLIDKASVVKEYFEYLANKADENQQRAALNVLASLGYTDLVIKIVATDPSSSNVQTLAAIGATSGDTNAANSVVAALESIARTSANVGASTAADEALTGTQATSPSGSGDAVIVAGADKSLESAQFEVDKLKSAGFEDAQVVKRGDWYRTIVPVQSHADSTTTLSKIKSQGRSSAYIVDSTKWCKETPEGTDCAPTQP